MALRIFEEKDDTLADMEVNELLLEEEEEEEEKDEEGNKKVKIKIKK